MTKGPLLLLLLLSLSTCELEDDSVGFIKTLPVVAELSSANSSLSFTAGKESLIKLKLLCYHDTGAFTTAFLRRDDTMQIVVGPSVLYKLQLNIQDLTPPPPLTRHQCRQLVLQTVPILPSTHVLWSLQITRRMWSTLSWWPGLRNPSTKWSTRSTRPD